ARPKYSSRKRPLNDSMDAFCVVFFPVVRAQALRMTARAGESLEDAGHLHRNGACRAARHGLVAGVAGDGQVLQDTTIRGHRLPSPRRTCRRASAVDRWRPRTVDRGPLTVDRGPWT